MCKNNRIVVIALTWTVVVSSVVRAEWIAESPRDEIKPVLQQLSDNRLSISADHRAGLNGWWTSTLSVIGGQHYRFSVDRKTTGMNAEEIRRAAVVRLIWQTDDGRKPVRDEPTFASYRAGENPRAQPELLPDAERNGEWTTVANVYKAPLKATRVRVELHFRWGPPPIADRVVYTETGSQSTGDAPNCAAGCHSSSATRGQHTEGEA